MSKETAILRPETPQAAKARRASFSKHLTTSREAEAGAVQPEWAVDGMFPKVGVVVVCGAAKFANKTFLMLELTRCITQGIPFLGRKTVKQIVLLANVEDGSARLGWRGKMLDKGSGKMEEGTDFALLKSRDGLSSLMACIDDPKLQADVIIIDPLVEAGYVLGLKNENDPLEMAGLIRPFRDAAQKCKRLIILVHHFRKDGDMARGSSALQGAVDGWIDIFPGEEQDLKLLSVTLRDGPPFEIGVQLSFTETSLKVVHVDPNVARKQKKKKKENGDQGGLRQGPTASDLYDTVCLNLINLEGDWISKDHLKGACGTSMERVDYVLGRLLEQGSIQVKHGKGVRWRIH